ncbi:undecaprenyldiphospho-muramoylpentapeptide beta-N-acetylglucosaminyltransferase [soil metagenome]
MKIAIVGGHLSPALGVIDALSSSDTVVFLGRKYALEGDKAVSLEYQEIIKRGITFLPLTTTRLQRKLTARTLPSFLKLPVGLYQAVSYLRAEKPDVVLSFGGYLSIPVGYAAKFLGIPLVIHEQTLEAGLANKVLGKLADKICISWETSSAFFPKNKTVLTGNPLKEFSIGELPFKFSKTDVKFPLLYITGGSTGSHALNTLVLGALADLVKKFRIIHQTGDSKEFKDYDKLTHFKESLTDSERGRYIVEKFITPSSVGSLMQEATLVVSRSGMNTVNELMFFGKPSVLIPLPHGQRQEQANNARFLQNLGLAIVLPQETATTAIFYKTIEQMVENKEKYLKHVKDVKALLHPRAAHEILHTLSYVAKKKSS